MRLRKREVLIFLALTLVGAAATFLAFRHVPMSMAEAGDTRDSAPRSESAGPLTSAGANGSTSVPGQPPGQPPGQAPGTGGPTAGTAFPPPPGGGGGQAPTTNAGQPSTTAPGQSPTASPTPPAVSLVTVPYLYGYSEGAAVSELVSAGLQVSADYKSTLNQCYVIDQNPQGDAQVPSGTTVHITIATNEGPCEAA